MCPFWVAGDGCRCADVGDLQFGFGFLALCSGSRGLQVGFWLIPVGVWFTVGRGRLRGGSWWVCGVACRGGGGFFVHSGGVGMCFIFHFYVESNTVKYFQSIFQNANKHRKNNIFLEIICI